MRQLITAFVISVLIGCGGGGSSQPQAPGTPVVSAPDYLPQSNEINHIDFSEAGIAQADVATAYTLAESQTGLRSLLVLKQGRLLSEQYFNGHSAQQLQHVRSVTKTVTALLTGIAIEEGLLSLESTLGEFFLSEYQIQDVRAESVTVAQLLTMSSGFDWDESGAELYVEWAQSEEPIEFLLSRSLTSEPGEAFTYNSAAVHLLGAILSKVTENSLQDFARSRLFQPLQITNWRWERLADGRFNGSAGLELRSIDLAKLGLLLLNNGRYTSLAGETTQIIPEHWLLAMKEEHVNLTGTYSSLQYRGYGYLWWLGKNSTQTDSDFELAWGWGGQFILTHTASNTVLVTNNDWSVLAGQASQQQQATLAILIDSLLNTL